MVQQDCTETSVSSEEDGDAELAMSHSMLTRVLVVKVAEEEYHSSLLSSTASDLNSTNEMDEHRLNE